MTWAWNLIPRITMTVSSCSSAYAVHWWWPPGISVLSPAMARSYESANTFSGISRNAPCLNTWHYRNINLSNDASRDMRQSSSTHRLSFKSTLVLFIVSLILCTIDYKNTYIVGNIHTICRARVSNWRQPK